MGHRFVGVCLLVGCHAAGPPEAAVQAASQALGLCGEPLCFLAADTLLNTTVAGAQDLPALATTPQGATLLVFRDRSGLAADATNGDALRARLFDAQGLPSGDDFVVETETTKVQTSPAVAAATDGTFLVVWADNRAQAPDAAGYAVLGRRFGPDGRPLDALDFVVNLTTAGDQLAPAVAATPDGGFLVAWRDTSRRAPDTVSGAIRARRVAADGTLAPAEIDVNGTTAGDQSEPALAVAPDGTWAVAFTDASLTGGDASGTQVRVRFFGADDAPGGPDARVSVRTERDQRQPDLAFAPDGSLLVVYTDYQAVGAATGYDVRARRFDGASAAWGDELDVATTLDRNQSAPAVAALANEGRWLVAFTDDSRAAPDISSTGLRGRLLTFDGGFDGPDQVLATATYGAQAAAALPARPGALTLVAWTDAGNVPPDTAAPAIRGRWLRFPRCGDGRTDPDAGEACDDGNQLPGDGCGPDCQREPPTREECQHLCRAVASYDPCNGSDDDCDGQVDEDGALGFDTSHCGGCDQGPCPATRPYTVRLSAPAGSTRWEPSGAAVAGDRLWVANDKDGVLAAYALPLANGANAPVQTLTVRPGGSTPKWEAMRVEAAGTFLLLNATGNTVWRCDPAAGCGSPVQVDVAAAVSALGSATRLESLAPTAARLFLGSRATPSKVADETGTAVTLGSLSPDGRAYQLSDALYTDGRFFLLWSHEAAGTTLRDVAGALAVARPDANGRPDPLTLRVCRALVGKPEGLDRWGDRLVVVFDQDDDRKAKGAADPNRFELLSTEDFATVLPLGVCD